MDAAIGFAIVLGLVMAFNLVIHLFKRLVNGGFNVVERAIDRSGAVDERDNDENL